MAAFPYSAANATPVYFRFTPLLSLFKHDA
jgi:hypothetical protein